ncbi:ribonuclease HII [Orrella sp. 11846]|uniref:ribonuclease HII n=1 Tax=Orrella sp. 11846 TaxID=3409913 RepID=UPI003B5C8B77
MNVMQPSLFSTDPKTESFDELGEPKRLWIAGVDEAGRGPLAGDVFAAAVVLDPERPIGGLDDSKRLTEKRRNELAQQIRERSLAWALGQANVQEIDALNILQATMLAMKRAILQIQVPLAEVLIDGNKAPEIDIPTRCIVGGDASIAEISAASILAKTARDASMQTLHAQYPEYGFDQHKGYGTALHRERLLTLGPTPEHRRSFAPLRQWLLNQSSS